MRIFYAVKFDDYIKESLDDNLTEIQKHILRCSFTEKENFHITLFFVGECEVNRLENLEKAADNTAAKLGLSPIKAIIGGLGTFGRSGEELLWAGVKTEPENILYKINKTLSEELESSNIKTDGDNKKFTPHVTIARKVEFWGMSAKDLPLINFKPIYFTINSITLMESVQEIKTYGEKRYTKVIYKPLYEVKF